MWILPNNYPLYSAFAQDMVESKEDLSLPGLNIESSLMSKSKPTQLKTWQRRWKTVSWMPRLFGRILKPSQRTSFEEKLTSLLEATHVSPSAQQDSAKEQTTPDTSGLSSENISEQLDLLNVSSRMSRDISRLDSPQLSATWKKMVIAARSEFSARKTSGLTMSESECLSLPTPTVWSAEGGRQKVQWQNGFKTYREKSKQWFGAKLRSVLEMNQPVDFVANPSFVEEMMGVPIGWTDIDF